MKLMTTLLRTGGSIHTIEANEYHFKPEKAGGDHVCNVDDDNHLQRFLSIDGFKIAGTKAVKAAPAAPPVTSTPTPPEITEQSLINSATIPANAITANVVTPAPADDTAPTPLEAMTRDELADIHKEVTGKKPHYKWEHAKIIAEIRANAGE